MLNPTVVGHAKKENKNARRYRYCFYIGGIIAAIDPVMTARTAQGSVAWAVSLVASHSLRYPPN
jgi:hypothetical protein